MGKGGNADTGTYFGDSVSIPQLGEYDLSPRSVKVAECILAVGDTAGTPAASSDYDADILCDTLICELFHVAGSSDLRRGVFVMRVVPFVVTAFTAAIEGGIGDTDDVNGWFDDTLITSWSSTSAVVSNLYVGGTDDVGVFSFFGGKHFPTSSGHIEMTFATADPVKGRMAIYAQYFIADRPGMN